MKKDCPICASASEYIFTSKLRKDIFHCVNRECGHFFIPVFIQNQGICFRENIEEESNEFLKQFDERNSRLFGLLRSFLQIHTSPIKFLDFGAGNAHISRTFKNLLSKDDLIYCLEANPLCADLYQKYGLIQVKNIEDVPTKIDLIYMIEVIEHLENPIQVMIKLKALLKETGKIFISTPAGDMDESKTNAFDTDSHLHFFTDKSLNLALEKAGLKAINYRYYPEMYPIPKTTFKSKINLIIKYFFKVANFANKNLHNNHLEHAKITHLVGITEIKT